VNLVNCTPHPIRLLAGEPGAERILDLPPSGAVARAAEQRQQVGTVEAGGVSLPVYEVSYGGLEGLPEPAPGTVYLVSAIAARAAAGAGRQDCLVTADPVRDDQGRITGARALARVS
jgi:hypothetical protein